MRGIEIRDSGVLLTGASSGIGRELALELGRRGARLAVSARREALLEELADEVERAGGVRPVVLPADLAQRGAASELAERAAAALHDVDVLINNAGSGSGGSQWVVGDRDEGREVLELNLWSPLALVAALVPPMREHAYGAVVNVTSMVQVMGWGGLGYYAASKAALGSATQSLRQELTGSGVNVLEVIPGPTDTATQGESMLVPGAEELLRWSPLGKPRTVARLTVRALRWGRRRVIYPRGLRIAYQLPGLARRQADWVYARLDTSLAEDRRVVRGGSQGDELARAARERWEQMGGGRAARRSIKELGASTS
jgi:short-subunit dehydrogenase